MASVFSTDDFQRIGHALDKLGEWLPDDGATNLLRLLATTGYRFHELARLTWREVHVEAGLLILCEAKSGACTRVIGQAACSILVNLPRDPERPETVFSPTAAGKVPRVWIDVLKRAHMPRRDLSQLRRHFGAEALRMGHPDKVQYLLNGFPGTPVDVALGRGAFQDLHALADAIADPIAAALRQRMDA